MAFIENKAAAKFKDIWDSYLQWSCLTKIIYFSNITYVILQWNLLNFNDLENLKNKMLMAWFLKLCTFLVSINISVYILLFMLSILHYYYIYFVHTVTPCFCFALFSIEVYTFFLEGNNISWIHTDYCFDCCCIFLTTYSYFFKKRFYVTGCQYQKEHFKINLWCMFTFSRPVE